MKNSGHMEVEIEQFLLRWSAGFENDQYFEAARRDIVDLIIKSRGEGRLEGVKAGLDEAANAADKETHIFHDNRQTCTICAGRAYQIANEIRSLPADKIAEEIK